MNPALRATLPRPARPPAPPLPDLDRLDRTHLAALGMLSAFDRLLCRLEVGPPDDIALACACEVIAFFEGPGREHHALEERVVFPPLLASGDGALVRQVRRLQQDHEWLEEDWQRLLPQVQAIAQGGSFDLAHLRDALPAFTALTQEHIALEELLIYPAARRRLQAHRDERG